MERTSKPPSAMRGDTKKKAVLAMKHFFLKEHQIYSSNSNLHQKSTISNQYRGSVFHRKITITILLQLQSYIYFPIRIFTNFIGILTPNP